MSSVPPDDPLSAPLAEWHVNPPRDPNFRATVWSRIDAAARPSTWSRFARSHAMAVSGLMAAAILVGAWSGRSEARDRAEADRHTIAANYVHGLDARWMRHP